MSPLQNQNLYDNCSITKAQSQYTIISYAIRHGLTGTALNDLLKLIDIHLPEGTDFTRSKYLLMKHLLTNEGQLEYHAVCLNCPDSYIGTEDAVCPKCNTLIVVKDCVKSGDFFTVFKLREQIKALLDDPATSKHLNIRERRQHCDNYRGSRYKALPLRPDDLSLYFNTDGVPFFEDSIGLETYIRFSPPLMSCLTLFVAAIFLLLPCGSGSQNRT